MSAFDLSTEFLNINAEDAFVGCLLHLPPARAASHCRAVVPGDLEDPRLRAIFMTVKDLALRGVSPEPAAILADMRRSGSVLGPQRLTAVSVLLIDLFTAAPAAPMAEFYQRSVLESALRRRATEAGTRIAQAADECSVAGLLAIVATENTAVMAAAQRWNEPPLRGSGA